MKHINIKTILFELWIIIIHMQYYKYDEIYSTVGFKKRINDKAEGPFK